MIRKSALLLLHQAYVRGSGHTVLQKHPVLQGAQFLRGWSPLARALRGGDVRFVHQPWAQDEVGELAVVAQQQQACGLAVQAAHWVEMLVQEAHLVGEVVLGFGCGGGRLLHRSNHIVGLVVRHHRRCARQRLLARIDELRASQVIFDNYLIFSRIHQHGSRDWKLPHIGTRDGNSTLLDKSMRLIQVFRNSGFLQKTFETSG
mmetsp:Transcript_29624/g.56943  ORF Transcript_29624/g.56943 Transcript_29624/m.56943 type:complete len:203 (+) Transcript_29624:718-1326(+)